jgi:hypothetical protein
MPGSNSETWKRFWAAVLWYSILLVPLLPFMAELLQGCTYVDRVGNKLDPIIHMLFPNNDAVFQDDNAPIHTAGTVQFSHSLKSMKVNFNIFPGQHIIRFEYH